MKKVLLALAVIVGLITLGVPASAEVEPGVTTDEVTTTEAPAAEAPAADAPAAEAPAADAPDATATHHNEDHEGGPPQDSDEEADLPEYICHVNDKGKGSEKNPYQTNHPANAGQLSGHLDHGGDGVWYPGAKEDDFNWGDIIPPVEGVEGLEEGLNWTEEGQAIWENGCKIPADTAETTDPTCEDDGALIVPEDTDLFSYVVVDNGDGTVTVNVIQTKNLEKYNKFIEDGKDKQAEKLIESSETFTIGEQLTGDECDEPGTPQGEDDPEDTPVLPNTGAPQVAYLWLGALLSAAGALLVGRRRMEA